MTCGDGSVDGGLAGGLAGIRTGAAGAGAIARSNSEPAAGSAVRATRTPAPVTAKRLDLGPDYSKGKPFFPNIFAPYTPIKVKEPELTNTPRLNQLIQDGKLMLSLDDAIALALENNLDIRVQRYLPWFGEVSLLRTEAGGVLEGVSNAPLLLGSGPSAGFDPIVQTQIGWESAANPVVNPFTSGTGTTSVSRLVTTRISTMCPTVRAFTKAPRFQSPFQTAESHPSRRATSSTRLCSPL